MSQPSENPLNFWAKLLKSSPLIAGLLIQGLIIWYLWAALNKANDAIVKCKEDDAATRERILNQSSVNGMKADNLYERQTLILSSQRELLETINELKRKRK